MPHYEAIVVGVGGIGSAALYHLARRGVRVLGLEQFRPGHDQGSSHGQTRVIRLASFEHPGYVPLVLRSFDLWRELQAQVGEQLFHQVGVLSCGPPGGVRLQGSAKSIAEHGLQIERLSADEIQERWPQFRVPEDHQALFEVQSGYLLVEECVKAHVTAAMQAGAELLSDVIVQDWKPSGQGVVVETNRGLFTADHLVLTVGPWAGQVLQRLGVRLQVLRKPLYWYQPRSSEFQTGAGCPCFLFETAAGMFYGFPQCDELGVKVAEHTGGKAVDDPSTIDRTVHDDERQRIEEFLTDYLPGITRTLTAHSVCMYTMSPDSRFIVDCHPEYPQIAFTAGLSGHGFKYAPVLGEIMADLVSEGATRHKIEFLSLSRF